MVGKLVSERGIILVTLGPAVDGDGAVRSGGSAEIRLTSVAVTDRDRRLEAAFLDR